MLGLGWVAETCRKQDCLERGSASIPDLRSIRAEAGTALPVSSITRHTDEKDFRVGRDLEGMRPWQVKGLCPGTDGLTTL